MILIYFFLKNAKYSKLTFLSGETNYPKTITRILCIAMCICLQEHYVHVFDKEHFECKFVKN